MTKPSPRVPRRNVLRYRDGDRVTATATLRAAYLEWRELQEPPLPERCDNDRCIFHKQPLMWNGGAIKPHVDHKNGVNTDNSPNNLRFLCPNCHSQCQDTNGGANKGRVTKSSGGFSIKRRGSALKDYTMKCESGQYAVDRHGATERE